MNKSFDRCWNPFCLPNHFRKRGLRPAAKTILNIFPEFRLKVFCRACRSQLKNYIGPRVGDNADEDDSETMLREEQITNGANGASTSHQTQDREDSLLVSDCGNNTATIAPIGSTNVLLSSEGMHSPTSAKDQDTIMIQLSETWSREEQSSQNHVDGSTSHEINNENDGFPDFDCDDNATPNTHIEITNIEPLSQETFNPPSEVDHDTVLSQLSEISLSPAETVLSRLDSDLALPIVNTSLEILNMSPIPKKKIKHAEWIEKKLDRVKTFVKKSLAVPDLAKKHDDATDFAKMISQLKDKFNSPSTTNAERYQILTLIPTTWSLNRVSEEFGASLYMVKKARKLSLEKGILTKPDAKIGKVLPEEVKSKVIDFYENDQVTVTLPGMKDFISLLDNNGQRIHVQKKLILCNLKELFLHFKEENTNVKIGFSSFASLRPRHCILAGGAGTHTVCVCPLHQNMKLMILGCNLSALTNNTGTPMTKFEDCATMLLCPDPQACCYLTQCENCPGHQELQDTLLKLFEENEIEEIKYTQWVLKPRATLETCVKPANEFAEEFCERAKNLLTHHFIAKQQSLFLKTSKDDLKEGECIVICDFAENYAFIVQNAAPGFHWNNEQATIYPVVVYYKRDGELLHKSLVVISDCLNHDSIAVYVFTRIVVEFIKAEIGMPSRIYYFSDGAPQQFKNYKNFINLWLHERDYSIPAEWHFFATAHGKGPCDGIGGTLKRLASRASLQLPSDRQILHPRDLFEWACTPNTLPSIAKRFSGTEAYEAAKMFLKERFDSAKAIPGTQTQHCFIPHDNGMITKLYSSSTEFKVHNVTKKNRLAKKP